jgi:hypothetical protein
MKSLHGPRLDRFLVIPAALQKVVRGRMCKVVVAKIPAGAEFFYAIKRKCRLKGFESTPLQRRAWCELRGCLRRKNFERRHSRMHARLDRGSVRLLTRTRLH